MVLFLPILNRILSFGGAYAPPQDKNFSLSLRTIGLVKQNSYSPSGQQGLRPQEKEKWKKFLPSLSAPILWYLLSNKNNFLFFLRPHNFYSRPPEAVSKRPLLLLLLVVVVVITFFAELCFALITCGTLRMQAWRNLASVGCNSATILPCFFHV